MGAAAISAGRLLDIFARHPDVSVEVCVSESSPGAPLASVHPQLRGVINKAFDAYDVDRLAACDVVFSCRKSGDTFQFIEAVLAGGAKLIDLSADYRLDDPAQFEKWHKVAHTKRALLAEAVYGMPELHREAIRGARLVANPGCYTTTAILACAPLVAAGLADGGPVVVDAISGVSGAGRGAKVENLFIGVDSNVRAYRVGTHQHTPEIEQELGGVRGPDSPPITVLFVPRVGPYRDGIMANCYLRPADAAGVTDDRLHELLQAKYAAEPFVRVLEPGALPQIQPVLGTNFCDIGATFDARTGIIVVISVTDNLVKGAAGQAVQNMNLMFGLDEVEGLGPHKVADAG